MDKDKRTDGQHAPAPGGDGTLRVLVALADPVARRAVARALEATPGIYCVGEVASGADAVARIEAVTHAPELVLMDEAMPDVDAVAAAHRIVESRPEVRVVMLAADVNDERGILALREGAAGYLMKDISLSVLPRVLRKVAEGEVAVPRTLTARLIDRLRELPETAGLRTATAEAPARLDGRPRGGIFTCGILGLAAGIGALIVALTLPHSAADAVADQAYIKPEYYVLLLIASGEAILTGLALAVLAVFRPYSVGAIRILLAVTAALAVLLVAGSAATLLAYHTTGVG